MDLHRSSASQSQLQQLKAGLKQWEHEFQTQHRRGPSKADVQACASIQQLYRQYVTLKTKLGKENECKGDNVHVQSDRGERKINESSDMELLALKRTRLCPPQPSSPSDDSSGSHISATPPKEVQGKCESQPFRVAHCSGIREPLQSISSSDCNKMPAVLNSNPEPSTLQSKSSNCSKRKTAVKTVLDARKNPSSNDAVGASSGAARHHQKDSLPACPLALEGGFIIRLHRHGMQLNDRQSSLLDDPLPAGFRSSSGFSSLIRQDPEACSVVSAKDVSTKDGYSTNPALLTMSTPGVHPYMENGAICGDKAESNGFILDQHICAEVVDRTQPINSSFADGMRRQFKLVSGDDSNPAPNEENETRNTSGCLGDLHEKDGLQNTSVVVLKRLLLKNGLPLTGNKSTLVTRLKKALLKEKQAGQPSPVEHMDTECQKQGLSCEGTPEIKHTRLLKREASKGPAEKYEHIVSQPGENEQAVSSMTIVALKRMLLSRGLPLKGNKSTLITRLKEALYEETEKPSTAEDTSAREDSKGPEQRNGDVVARLGEDQPSVQSLSATPASDKVAMKRITRGMLSTRTTDEVLSHLSENRLTSGSYDPERRQVPEDTLNPGKRKSLTQAHDSSSLRKKGSSTKRQVTESMTSDAPSSETVSRARILAGEGDKVPVVNASTKRVKSSLPLEENSWANPRSLQKGARSQKGRSLMPSKPRQQLCARPGERDNFVRLNINGKGGKRRKFLNGTRTRRPGAYGRSGTRGAKFKKNDRRGAADGIIAHEGNEDHQGGGCEPVRHCGSAGQRGNSLWANDGWLEPTTSPTGLEDSSCSNAVELNNRLKDVVIKAQNSPSDKNLTEVLRLVFGFNAFRTGQLEAVKRLISLQSTMVILPTGAGKSLCYQLPAYLLPGIILVISPLMALMTDQLCHLPPSLPGALISSAQTSQESSATIARLRAGQVKVLFISPERLFSESFLCALKELPKISLAVIDEAHCLSEWSHNFRPSYFRLGNVLHQQMKVSCVLAMTATATKKAENSIVKSLCIPADGVVQASHVRQNLFLSVSRETNRLKAILSMLQSSPYAEARSIIIYCTFQLETDYISGFLQQNGIQAKSYHAKKTSQERNRIYDLFCNNKLRVVVATVALGMGLDKSNVRAILTASAELTWSRPRIVHFNMPRSLEQYVQETGRAGRDGNPAFCHLFLDDGDYLKLRSLAYSNGVDEYSVNKFLSRVFGGCSASTRSGNLVSIIIETASRELDMKEEVMVTILSHLEVGEVEYVKVLSTLNATCTLSFHQSDPASLAGRNTFVAAILKRSKEKQGRYIFDIPSLATQLQLSLSHVQSELRRLQVAGEITYELSDSALCFTILQIPVDICLLTSTITERLAEAERCQVRKVDAMYLAASAAVHNKAGGVPEGGDVSLSCQQASLQTSIKLYFETEEEIPISTNVPTIIQSNSSFVRADIKVFLKSARNPNLTGRAVARIFHGLWSPAFSSSEWSKNHFWGQHARVDFGEIKQAAAAEILTQRATQGNLF